jgi:hypothetical protein
MGVRMAAKTISKTREAQNHARCHDSGNSPVVAPFASSSKKPPAIPL